MSRGTDKALSAAKLALTIKRLRSEQPNADLLLSEPIAVVGIGCRMPGGVGSASDYWRLLHGGEDAISEIPADRWDADAYYSPDMNAEGKMNTRWGGFIEQFDRFDPSFFGISPREASAMDPQQRLLLEVAWEALWDAGIAPDRLGGTSTGVFFGIYGTDYSRLLLENTRAIGSHTCAGAAHSMASGRVSFLLDLHGPSISVDTACSSSLVAIHLACESLRAGNCRMAMAGGVSLKFRPEHYLCLTKLGMTSPDGRCRTFDDHANGFVPGEGCGVVLLKPLSDALASGCRVYAVIRGTAANQDGRTNVLTAPSGIAQQKVINAALKNGRVSPGDISYVETHGTGTALGDPIEVEALTEAIGSTEFGEQPCALGAAKSNIGHLEAASGVAGFIKAVLALHHEEIPPNLHYHKLNPNVVLDGTRFYVPAEPTPWPRSENGRFAGVSSFGFSGTNVHLVLEESPRLPVVRSASPETGSKSFVLPISARTPEACDQFARAYRAFLDGNGRDLPLYNICHSASARRSHYEERLAITASSAGELCRQLDEYLAGVSRFGVARGRAARDSERVAFVFSGQGSQWPRMGLGLYSRFPVFRASLDECDAQIRRFAGWSVIELLSDEAKLAHTEYAQPALFAIEVSLAKLWQSWGVIPLAVIGHSAGEIAAAHVSGALSLETAARVIVLRARLMEAASGFGKMAVIHQAWTEVAKELGPFGKTLSIACVNSPKSTVVSGEPASVDALVARRRERGITSRPVRVDYAFHSPQMQPFSEALSRELGSVPRQAMTVQMISTVTGKRAGAPDLDAGYWARNIRQPVLFANAIQTAISMGARTFLEIGPHPVLLDSVAECLDTEASPSLLIPSMRREAEESATILSALGTLYVGGCPVDWGKVYEEEVAPVSLPVYPYQRQKVWVETPRQVTTVMPRPFNTRRLRSPGLSRETYETQVGLGSMPYLADHKIGGTVLLPMTGFIEIARRALEASGRNADALSDFAIVEPLLFPDRQDRTVQVIFDGDQFQILSLEEDDWVLHATGASAPVSAPVEGVREAPQRREYVDSRQHYASLADSSADFGPAFQTVRGVSAGAGFAWAQVQLAEQEAAEAAAYLSHPALLDGCLQTVVAALPADQNAAYLPFGLAKLEVLKKLSTEVTVCARLHPESAGDFVSSDIDIWHGDQLAARIRGFRMKRLSGDARLDRRIYEVQWREAKPDAPVRAIGGDWLILSNDRTAADRLSLDLTRMGCAVRVVPAATSLEGIGRFRSIVRLHEAEADAAGPEGAMEVTDRARALVTEIVRTFPADPPQLWLITRVADNIALLDSGAGLLQSPITGLARTIAMEHPEIRCTRIDIDSASNSLDCVAREMAEWDGEAEVAYRDRRRFVPRLRRAIPASKHLKRWTAGHQGSIEGLITQPIEQQRPAAHEIQVDVEASALNFRDVLTVLGMYPGPAGPLGLEFCGRVAQVGEGVSRFRVGDRVAGIGWGSFASTVCTSADLAFPVPEHLTSLEAVTVPNAFLTAYHCLVHLGKLRRGQRVLIHAATGGVGLAAVQLAKLAGAEVFASAGSEEKREHLRKLGVTQIFNSRSLDFAREIHSATAGAGVDLILNSLAGDFITAGFSVLRSGGCFVEIGKNSIWTEEQARTRRPDCRYYVVDLAPAIDKDTRLVHAHLSEIERLLQNREITPLPFHVFAFDDAPLAFRLMSQARHIGKIVLRHASEITVRKDRSYLITGGMGAVGLSAAEWLASRGARHLVFIGRRAPSSRAVQVIRQLEKAGVEVLVRAADVSSRNDLEHLFDEMGRLMPSLAGVIHAAGVLDDGVLSQQTSERLRRVMSPKVMGAQNLHDLTKTMALDFFFLFSSIASVTGSPAQAGYTAANAWLDGFAHYRYRHGLPALAINWGAWRGGGMATEVDAGGKRHALAGVKSMSPEEYWKCLEKAITLGKCQVAIADADWNKWFPMPSILTGLVQNGPARVSAEGPRMTSEQSIRDRLADTPKQNRRSLLLEFLREQVRQILGLGSSYLIDEREPLVRMGLDSLMAVEMRNHLSSALGRPLMATLLFDYPTLSSLADFLLGEEKTAIVEKDHLLEELQELSDSEAEELLKHELESL